MDKTQMDIAGDVMRGGAALQGECTNLKSRLKLAESELKADKSFQSVANAAKVLAREVALYLAESPKVLKIKDKDMAKMDVAEFKKKADRTRVLAATTSDAATNYFAAYRKSHGDNPKIGACVSANACSESVRRIPQYASEVKIAYNRLK